MPELSNIVAYDVVYPDHDEGAYVFVNDKGQIDFSWKPTMPYVNVTLRPTSFAAVTVLQSDMPMEDKLAALLAGDTLPTPRKTITNGPATVVLWEDGTKTVTKCHGDDEQDPAVGAMNCALRKLTRNRARIDDFEGCIGEFAGLSPDELREQAAFSELMADALVVAADVMEAEEE